MAFGGVEEGVMGGEEERRTDVLATRVGWHVICSG